MRETTLRIGQLATRAAVPVDTIRYYERIGLLAPAERTSSGYRCFEPSSVLRLRFIRRAQNLGFSLEEIGDLLALRLDGGTSCDEVRAKASQRLSLIERKLSQLGRMRAALAELVAACASNQTTGECPILGALAQEDDDEPDH